jgi:hypothetical protein
MLEKPISLTKKGQLIPDNFSLIDPSGRRCATLAHRRAYFYVLPGEAGSASDLAAMTPQLIKAMVAAGREYEDAVKAFDAAIEKNDSKPAISEALSTMIEKRKAYQAFGERVS